VSASAGAPAPRVVLGVSGGIAAYKACELLRRLTESGHDVTVVPTAAALEFVGAPTWSALSGKRVSDRVWDDVHEVPHVRIGQQADLVVVAPATADLLAKAAHGLADDLLTNTLLTARCPVVLAPAMHTEMWEHPATQPTAATLRSRGVQVVEPAVGTTVTSCPSRCSRRSSSQALYAAMPPETPTTTRGRVPEWDTASCVLLVVIGPLSSQVGHSPVLNDASTAAALAAASSAASSAGSTSSQVSRSSLISRSAIERGFSWTCVSTRGPTYSSRPSPSCE